MRIGLLGALVTLVSSYKADRAYGRIFLQNLCWFVNRLLKIASKIYRAYLFETILQACLILAPFSFQ